MTDTFLAGDGKRAPLAVFRDDSSGRVETCAFIDEDSVTVRIGCLAAGSHELPRLLNLCRRVVGSYIFLGLKTEVRE